MTSLATIKNGTLEFTPIFKSWMKEHEGKTVRIEPAHSTVSEEMRGYYWAAVIPTSKDTIPEWKLRSDDDVHEMLKKNFNGFTCFNPITKRTERFGRSAMSGESNTARAMEYVEKIRMWLLEEYGVELPNPEEYKKIRDEVELK